VDYRKEGVRIGPSAHGRGVFCLRQFAARQLIGRVRGTIMEDPDYGSDYCMQLGEDRALEPGPPFCYLNHSCHPNCALVEYEVERTDGTTADPELWVETLTEIAPGEQMTIDYCWPAAEAIPCRCGSPDCRGCIVAPDQLERAESLHRGA
jgi:uncharacterized protein